MAASAGNFPSYAALVAELPARFVPYGTTAVCLDVGQVYSNGVYWWPVGSGSGGNTPLFSNSVSASLGSGPLNDLAPAGYVGGVTNRMILTPASGGSIIDGISSVGVPDGFTMKLSNPSTTDYLEFTNLSGSDSNPDNQMRNPGGGAMYINYGGSALITYEVDVWTWV